MDLYLAIPFSIGIEKIKLQFKIKSPLPQYTTKEKSKQHGVPNKIINYGLKKKLEK